MPQRSRDSLRDLLSKQQAAAAVSPQGISQEQYIALYDAYARHRSISRAADAAGVGYATAKRYIEETVDGMPPIRSRVVAVRDHVLNELDEQRAQELRYIRGMQTAMLKKLVAAQMRVSYEPKGVEGPNGETIIDTAEMNAAITALSRLSSLSESLELRQRGERTAGGHNIHVTALAGAQATTGASEGLPAGAEHGSTARSRALGALTALLEEGAADDEVAKVITAEIRSRG